MKNEAVALAEYLERKAEDGGDVAMTSAEKLMCAMALRAQSATEQFTMGDAHPCDISRAVREQTMDACVKEVQTILADVKHGGDTKWREGAMYAAERCLRRVLNLRANATNATTDSRANK